METNKLSGDPEDLRRILIEVFGLTNEEIDARLKEMRCTYCGSTRISHHPDGDASFCESCKEVL